MFSNAVHQQGFEIKSPKLSEKGLNFTGQADQSQLLEDGMCPDVPLKLIMHEKEGHPYMSLSSKDPIYMPSYPCNLGPQQTLHTP